MANTPFFFVNVCHRLVLSVYFAIVPIGYMYFTLIAYEVQALQYAHISM